MQKEHPEWTVPPPFKLPEPPNFADKNFVNQTRQLIEVLIGDGYQADAEKIQQQAVALLDDGRLKSAVADAQQAVQAHEKK
jgi:hypothetical protein